MSTAVITIVSGRHRHLENQQRGLLSGTVLPDQYVVVAMDDPVALRLTAGGPLAGSTCAIILPDGGAGYLDTVYDDDWVKAELGCTPSEVEWATRAELRAAAPTHG